MQKIYRCGLLASHILIWLTLVIYCQDDKQLKNKPFYMATGVIWKIQHLQQEAGCKTTGGEVCIYSFFRAQCQANGIRGQVERKGLYGLDKLQDQAAF